MGPQRIARNGGAIDPGFGAPADARGDLALIRGVEIIQRTDLRCISINIAMVLTRISVHEIVLRA